MATAASNTSRRTSKTLQITDLLNEPQPYNTNWQSLPQPTVGADQGLLSRIQGSLVGLAVGDALGASVEFRPHTYLQEHPVTDMQSGGTWGLQAGQWTDDTSMALCLAASLIVKQGFDAYDQLVRYKWWYKDGYMSSIGKCFDIGQATRLAVIDFEKRQLNFAERFCQLKPRTLKSERDRDTMISQRDCVSVNFKLNFGSEDSAGNGPLMRMASIPLFFFRSEKAAINYAGENAVLTHGDPRAADACRFYAALICGALQGLSKYELLDPKFYRAYHFSPPLHLDVIKIAEGSYKKKNGYKDGIRGKGYVLDALEATLWGVWNDQDSFERGVLSVVNLGDDTDTTAAIYGQLAGALYRIKQIPERWIQTLFQGDFIITMANWLYLGGELWWKENSPNALIALHPGYTSSESVH